MPPIELPSEYLELLRWADGGWGDLGAAPLLFGLDKVADALAYNDGPGRDCYLVDVWIFGHNGGLEQIAFDLRSGPPWQIVVIDPIAGAESAKVVAGSMAEFVPLIGCRE